MSDGDIRRDESDAADGVMFGGAFVEHREDLDVPLRERACDVHDHPEQIRERRVGRKILGMTLPSPAFQARTCSVTIARIGASAAAS
jgi:hypothetical protein